MAECLKCHGEKYYKNEQGLWVACDCGRYESMKAVIDLAIGEVLGEAELAKQLGEMTDENIKDDWVFYIDVKDPRIVNWAAAYVWSRAGFSNSFRKIDTNDIIKIFVQETAETEPCKSLADLSCYENLAIYAGFHEHVNNSLPNLFANLVEHRQMKRRYTWVFVKGKVIPEYARYYYDKVNGRQKAQTVGNVELKDFLKDAGFNNFVYEIGKSTSVPGAKVDTSVDPARR